MRNYRRKVTSKSTRCIAFINMPELHTATLKSAVKRSLDLIRPPMSLYTNHVAVLSILHPHIVKTNTFSILWCMWGPL